MPSESGRTRTIVDDLSIDGSRVDLPPEPLNRELSGKLTRHLTRQEQTILHRALRRSVRIIDND